MLRYLYADRLDTEPHLRDTMFRDRATQFRDRLGWPVAVDADGFERDAYDALNPLYVIWQGADGRHGGSMRFLPTTGPTMVNEHFRHVTGGDIVSPLIWECTRFCLAPDAEPRVTAALVLGAGTLIERFALRHLVGVFDRRMERIYARIGARPEVIGRVGAGRAAVAVGLWVHDEALRPQMLAGAGIARGDADAWWDADFGASQAERKELAAAV